MNRQDLINYQARLLNEFYEQTDGTLIKATLLADPVLEVFTQYLSSANVALIAVAAELTKTWGVLSELTD